MRKLTAVALAAFCVAAAAPAGGQQIKIGVLLGFTGPIESLTPPMAAGAELALKEVSESGKLLGGAALVAARGDSTCTDAAAATTAAERLATAEAVAAIIGADCSGVTMAVATKVSAPAGIPTISPSATSPSLSTVKDNGYFFRVSPSDARQGQVLAKVVKDRGISNVALTYTNNDYGKGLANSFSDAFKALGGKVAISAGHEDGKGDYAADVGALAASGAKHLAVFGYVDQGGKGIIRAALDSGAFGSFILADGMYGDSLTKDLGDDVNGAFGTVPGSNSPGASVFQKYASGRGVEKADNPFVGESYDAAALIALAMQAAKSKDRKAIRSKIIEVANAPGEKIMPGQLAKGLEILAAGGDVDYVGATNVEMNEVGEVHGSYREFEIKNRKFETVSWR